MAYSPSIDIPGTDDTHLGNRWFNPKTGAFTQPDPLTQLDDPHNPMPILTPPTTPAAPGNPG